MILFIKLLFSLALLPLEVAAFEPPPLTGPVMDTANIIDDRDEAYLEQLIRQLNLEGRAQLQVLTVPNLQGDVLEQATIDTVEKYQLGSKTQDNGLLIFVARDERKVRIEVGQGLEGNIPDLLAHRIIEQKISPEFKNGRFGAGLIAAVGSVEALLDPAQQGAANKSLGANGSRKKGSPISIVFIIILFVVLSTLRAIAGGGRGRRGRSAWYAGGLGAGLGGLGGGFGGGGGGWSGGGGGFSGGGASGGW